MTYLKRDELGRVEIVGEGELKPASADPTLQAPSMIVTRAKGMASMPPSTLVTMTVATAKSTLLNYPGADAAVAQLKDMITRDPGQAAVALVGMARILVSHGIAK